MKEAREEQFLCKLLGVSLQTRLKVKMILTFRKQPTTPIHQVPPQIPSVAKIIIALDQLDTVAFGQTQLI